MGKSVGTPKAPPTFKPFEREFAAARPPTTRSPPTVPTMAIRIQFGPLRRGRTAGGPGIGFPGDGAGSGEYIVARTTVRTSPPCPPGTREGKRRFSGRNLVGGVDGAGAHGPLHAVLRLEQDPAHRAGNVLPRKILVGHLDGVVIDHDRWEHHAREREPDLDVALLPDVAQGLEVAGPRGLEHAPLIEAVEAAHHRSHSGQRQCEILHERGPDLLFRFRGRTGGARGGGITLSLV